ncbi:hypothetical protein CRG98_013018 [Punica granatum]|uniref:Uncharacterized protein n=1 Tax=Punica granatum TaxID=22663 RepID=A0A2I0KEA5_PUNGR|nr:hypothetical protein CRG98_013018 [Punica granatum]
MKIGAFAFIIHTETTSNIIRPSKQRTLGHPRLKLATARPRQATYTGAPLVKVRPEVAIAEQSASAGTFEIPPGADPRLYFPLHTSHFIAFHGFRPRILLLSTGFGLALYSFSGASASHFAAFHGLRPGTLLLSTGFGLAFYYFPRASALQPPLHILQIPIMLLSYDRRGELPRRMTTEAVARTKKSASHDLWLPPLIEHAIKEGQAVSTPFRSIGSNG